MSAEILDGKAIAKQILTEVAAELDTYTATNEIVPTVAIVRAGEDPASVWYAGAIGKTMSRYGMKAVMRVLDADATEEEIIRAVDELNRDTAIHGIMIQEPLPEGISEDRIKLSLSPLKDIDGVHEVNAGRLMLAGPLGRDAGTDSFFAPATPMGGIELLRRCNIELAGRNAVIVGRSSIVGKPLALLLLRENATVTICHSKTNDLPAICREADILCVAVGRPNMIRSDWVRDGATVVDFGINEVDGSMVGDVAFDEVAAKAGAITPVPGGTGPVTNAVLCRNLLQAAKLRIR